MFTDFREERTHSRIRNPAWTGFPVSYLVPFTAVQPYYHPKEFVRGAHA